MRKNEIVMTPESIQEIQDALKETLLKKNADYGSASFDLGLNGNMVHIWDKSSRFRNLVEKSLKSEKSVTNFESLEDTLNDLIGYAIIGLHILNFQKDKITTNTDTP